MKKEDLLKIFPELTEEQYAEIQRLNGLDVNPIKAERDNLKSQLDETKKALKGFEGLDIEGKDKKIAELQADLKAKDKEYKDFVYKTNLDQAIEKQAKELGVRNVKAILGLVNMDKVSLDNGNLIGFKDQVEAYKESDPYLFIQEEKESNNSPPKFVKPGGNNEKTKTVADIMAIVDPVERNEAIQQNLKLFET